MIQPTETVNDISYISFANTYPRKPTETISSEKRAWFCNMTQLSTLRKKRNSTGEKKTHQKNSEFGLKTPHGTEKFKVQLSVFGKGLVFENECQKTGIFNGHMI